MGWLYMHKPHDIGTKDFLLHHAGVFKWSPESDYEYKVLDSALVKLKTFYAAIEQVHKTTGERRVWAAVLLVNYAPKDHHNFGYKDMDESMGPCESECPERILKLLTETEYEYAKDWRKRCWANIERRKNRPPIEPGCTIVLHGDEYKVTAKLGRKGYRISGTKGTYRLPLSWLSKLSEVRPAE